MADLRQVQCLQLSGQVVQSLSVLDVFPLEVLLGLVHLVLCELSQIAGVPHRAAFINGGGVGLSFCFL